MREHFLRIEGFFLPGSFEILLSPGVFSSGHHLHGRGDLLDVLDRLEAEGNDLEVSHASLLLVHNQNLVGGLAEK